MIQATDHYASSRTAEIMSRYRPIAPRPETLSPNSVSENDHSSGLPTSIQKSPYLRNVWAHLQARPTRTRKRARAASFAPPSAKRARACLQGLIPTPARNLAMHGFAHAENLVPTSYCLDTAVTTLAQSVALPLFCYQPPATGKKKEKGIDLNLTAGVEELDLSPQLTEAVKSPRVIISPRPVRPVVSSVLVEKISDDLRQKRVPVKGAEEVEEMVEAEKVPTIVSDLNNKVRMCNSAYKELVGQPECGWLDCTAGKQCGGERRIGGEISLNFVHSKVQQSMHGFKCRVKIEWESKGIKKSVNAYCHGVTLACPATDYQFLWKFYEIDQGLKTGSGD